MRPTGRTRFRLPLPHVDQQGSASCAKVPPVSARVCTRLCPVSRTSLRKEPLPEASISDQIRQQVTDRIHKALAEELVSWGRPWLGHRNDGPPTNALTSLPFRGVNPLLLKLAGFSSKWWATERCWTAFGYRLKPHQHGVQVFYG
jgi:hypothetical protein